MFTTFSMHTAGKNVAKYDYVGSCLIELQSSTLSNPQITPMYCILVYFPIVFVMCDSGLCHVAILFTVMTDEHWIHGYKEHRMPPFLDVFATQDEPKMNDPVRIVGTSNMVDVLGEIAR